MAKQTKTVKRLGVTQPTSDDFERTRNHLLQRADALIIELAKLYHASKSEELTAIMNAMDSATELGRMRRTSVPQY